MGTQTAAPAAPERGSFRELARRLSVTEGAVRKGVRTGRFEQSVGRDERVPYIADMALAEQEWRQNADPSKGRVRGRPPRGSLSLAELKRRVAAEDLRTRRIKNDKEMGTLLPRRALQLAVAEMLTLVKTGCLAYPTRAKMRLPHLTASDLVELEQLMQETLEPLSMGRLPGMEDA